MTNGFLSDKEREYLQGLHDEMYYQYKANLRVRIQNKVDRLAEDLRLLLGNERLDNAKGKYDWDKIVAPVVEFARQSLDYDTIPVKAVELTKKR